MSYLSSPMSFHLRLMSFYFFSCLFEVEVVSVSDVTCQKLYDIVS